MIPVPGMEVVFDTGAGGFQMQLPVIELDVDDAQILIVIPVRVELRLAEAGRERPRRRTLFSEIQNGAQSRVRQAQAQVGHDFRVLEIGSLRG